MRCLFHLLHAQCCPTSSRPATPRSPTAKADDTRIGFNLSLMHRAGRHTLGFNPSSSTESDYTSFGLGLTDAIDFNQKNTTLTLGAAMSHDRVDAFYLDGEPSKDILDLMVGVTQLPDGKTTFTANRMRV